MIFETLEKLKLEKKMMTVYKYTVDKGQGKKNSIKVFLPINKAKKYNYK